MSWRAFFGASAAGVGALAQNRTRPANLIDVFADQVRRFPCGYFDDDIVFDQLRGNSHVVLIDLPGDPQKL